jgi:hypothetical protein
MPYGRSSNFLTRKAEAADGQQIAAPIRAAELPSWTIQYTALTLTEVDAITNLWAIVGGRYGYFSFTDPRDMTTVYSKCSFGMDELTCKHDGTRGNQMTVIIEVQP